MFLTDGISFPHNSNMYISLSRHPKKTEVLMKKLKLVPYANSTTIKHK